MATDPPSNVEGSDWMPMFLLDKMLRKIVRAGDLTVVTADGRERRYGAADPARAPVRIRFTDARAPDFIARHPRLGMGEAYMNGRVVVEQGDVVELLDLIRSNVPWERGGGIEGPKKLHKQLGKRLLGTVGRFNSLGASRRNVAHHYDLSDRLYDLFLDADRQYSCAYFTDADATLERAQADKKAHIAAKLALAPGQRVLDIGCGWGGMALYLNRVADVDVLGVTLSEEQLGVARRRAAEAGVADRVKFALIDYRELDGRFDRIVSVGMFEHVGAPHYRRFFATCRSLLADDGVMLLHTIGRLGGPGATDAFTAKYIFPGGYNPALSEILAASETAGLVTTDIETLRLHYALTLEHWYCRTVAARREIESIYDARFYRLWTFYLAGAISAFRHGGLVNYQLRYGRTPAGAAVGRDEVAAVERGLRGS